MPNDKQLKDIIGLFIAESTDIVMSNHFYTIDGQVRRQTDGGAIGSDKTGEVSRIFMILWDDKLVKKCKKLGITFDLYNRYVDDQTIITRAIGKGWRYNTKRDIMEFSSVLEIEDNDSNDTERTAKVIACIANSLDKGIQVTFDWPENDNDNRMPVLDLKVWISNENDYPIVCYSFFKKEVASNFTILKRSAVAESCKKVTLFQESLQRLLNIARWLPWSEATHHLSVWSNCMKVSGYSSRERFDAIRGAVMRYEEMCNRVDNGIIKSLHRDRNEIIHSKIQKGGYCASTWYLKNDTSSTIRCAPTPGGELAKLITRALNKE